MIKPGDLITFCNLDCAPNGQIPVYQDVANFRDWFTENWSSSNGVIFLPIKQIGMVLELIDIPFFHKQEYENAHKAIEFVEIKKEYLFYRVIVEDASIYCVYGGFILKVEK